MNEGLLVLGASLPCYPLPPEWCSLETGEVVLEPFIPESTPDLCHGQGPLSWLIVGLRYTNKTSSLFYLTLVTNQHIFNCLFHPNYILLNLSIISLNLSLNQPIYTQGGGYTIHFLKGHLHPPA